MERAAVKRSMCVCVGGGGGACGKWAVVGTAYAQLFGLPMLGATLLRSRGTGGGAAHASSNCGSAPAMRQHMVVSDSLGGPSGMAAAAVRDAGARSATRLPENLGPLGAVGVRDSAKIAPLRYPRMCLRRHPCELTPSGSSVDINTGVAPCGHSDRQRRQRLRHGAVLMRRSIAGSGVDSAVRGFYCRRARKLGASMHTAPLFSFLGNISSREGRGPVGVVCRRRWLPLLRCQRDGEPNARGAEAIVSMYVVNSGEGTTDVVGSVSVGV